MHPIEACIRNPVKVTVGVLLVALYGAIALIMMPMQLTPEVQLPVITIQTRWPGASPKEVEQEIVQEQEEQLKSVEGVIRMNSESRDSSATVTLEFRVGTDMREALLKVNSRLQQVPEYPTEADEPVISSSDANAQAIAWFILSPRMLTDEQLAEFVKRHPEMDEVLNPVRKAHNKGLAILRLRNIAEKHAVCAELLPENFNAKVPGDTTIKAALSRFPQHAAALQEVMDSATVGLKAVLLQKLGEKHPELKELVPPKVDISLMRKFAEDIIEARFERVPGVSNSNVLGGQDPEIQVIVDPQKLAARGLTILQVRNALRAQNRDTSGGDFWEGKRRYVVRTLGQFRSVKQVEHQVLSINNGTPVFVRDVARVRSDFKKPDGFVRRFGGTSIAVNAQRETGSNVLDVMRGLKAANRELNEGVLKRQGLTLTQVSDQTEYIYKSIGMVNWNLIIGGGLTVFVLLSFLRSARSTLVIGLAIPISIIGTFLLLYLMGRSLNVISLAGMAFAVGMLVDNAVVVLENIYRHYQMGEQPFPAAFKAAKEVWGAILASTLTTLAVFLPVIFVKEQAGQLFRDIALAISSAVGLSLIVSITVIPTAAARVLKRRTDEDETQAKRNILTAFGTFVVNRIIGLNEWIQRGVLRSLAVVVVLMATAITTCYLMWPKVEYLPTGNRNLVFAVMLPPPGYNVNQLDSMGELVENHLREYWDVDPEDAANREKPMISDFFYVARGRRLFLGARAHNPMRAGKLIPVVNSVSAKLPGTMVFASKASLFGRGLSAGRTIDIEITGPEITDLVRFGGQMMGKIGDLIYYDANGNGERDQGEPGARAQPIPSLDLSSPELHVETKLVPAAEMGILNTDIGYTVNALIDGAYVTDYFVGGQKIDLSILGSTSYDRKTQDLESIPISTPSGQLVPLSAVADVILSSGPEQINHRERQRAITIQVTPPDEVPLELAIEKINRQIVQPLRDSGQLDGGYTITLSGTADKLQQTWQALRWNVILALLITYLLMAALFESWVYPFVIFLSVPMGAVGGVLGLRLLGVYLQWWGETPQALDVLTMLGFVILIGTVVNNAILIVHQSLNFMRDEGLSAREALRESIRTRVRPIFMTTATTVFGLAPLVFFPGAGSELYRGLGSVVLGGLLVSTIFTLVLVPTMFSLMIRARRGWT